jgi:hypothetical protein
MLGWSVSNSGMRKENNPVIGVILRSTCRLNRACMVVTDSEPDRLAPLSSIAPSRPRAFPAVPQSGVYAQRQRANLFRKRRRSEHRGDAYHLFGPGAAGEGDQGADLGSRLFQREAGV